MSYTKDKLAEAIKVMKDACLEAETALNDGPLTDIKCAARILHCFPWGLANATSGIEAAMRGAEADLVARAEKAEGKQD